MTRCTVVLVVLVAACERNAPAPAPARSPPEPAAETKPAAPPPTGELVLEADPARLKATGPLPFRWSDGTKACRVPARQHVEKQGQEVVFAFDGVLRRAGDGWTFDLEGLTAVSIAGRAPTETEAAALATFSTIPTSVLEADGSYVEVRGMDEAVERVIATQGVPPEIATQLRSPKMRQVMAQSAGDHWNGLFGAFVGLELGGDPLEAKLAQQVAGATLPVAVKLVHHGAVKGRGDLQLVSLTQVIEGDGGAAGMRELLRSFAGDATLALDEISSVRVETTVTAALDPATGRPHRARTEKHIKIADQTRRDVRDTTFDWAKATGCGP